MESGGNHFASNAAERFSPRRCVSTRELASWDLSKDIAEYIVSFGIDVLCTIIVVNGHITLTCALGTSPLNASVSRGNILMDQETYCTCYINYASHLSPLEISVHT